MIRATVSRRRADCRWSALILGSVGLGVALLRAADAVPSPAPALPPLAPAAPPPLVALPTAPVAPKAAVTPKPVAAPASAPSAPAAAPVDTHIIAGGLADAVVADWVEYAVGTPPPAGVDSRVTYRIRYVVQLVRETDVQIVRTTLTREGRELAREVYAVARYPRLTPPPESAATSSETPAATPVEWVVAGRKLPALEMTETVREDGIRRVHLWRLSRAVPITGLVGEWVDGAPALELVNFGHGGVPGEAAPSTAAQVTPPPPPLSPPAQEVIPVLPDRPFEWASEPPPRR